MVICKATQVYQLVKTGEQGHLKLAWVSFYIVNSVTWKQWQKLWVAVLVSKSNFLTYSVASREGNLPSIFFTLSSECSIFQCRIIMSITRAQGTPNCPPSDLNYYVFFHNYFSNFAIGPNKCLFSICWTFGALVSRKIHFILFLIIFPAHQYFSDLKGHIHTVAFIHCHFKTIAVWHLVATDHV